MDAKPNRRTKRSQPDHSHDQATDDAAEAAPLPPPLAPPPPPPGELPHLGLVCRVCGCQHFITIKTRAMNANKIRRTKRCRHCGKRVHTEEKVTKEI